MIDENIRYVVYGIPATAGSKKGFYNPKTKRVNMVDTCKRKGPWMQQVALAAAEAMKGRPPLAQAVKVSMHFVFARPKSHRNSKGDLRKGKSVEHISKPDLTKLVRCAEDAMKGIVWNDDSQVAIQQNSKAWGVENLAIIVIEPLTATPGNGLPSTPAGTEASHAPNPTN